MAQEGRNYSKNDHYGPITEYQGKERAQTRMVNCSGAFLDHSEGILSLRMSKILQETVWNAD